jgi:cyclophilin family peptidyl-prolyl cis-trans isomerase
MAMARLLLLIGVVLSVLGGSPDLAITRQVDSDVETKLLLVLEATEEGVADASDLLAATARTIERRVAALRIAGARVWMSGGDQIVVELPGVNGDEADRFTRALTTTALLEVVDTQGTFLPQGTMVTTSLGGPSDGATSETDVVYETIISGGDIVQAYATTNQIGEQVVGFELTDEAAERFYEYTSTHLGQPLAIVLDKRVVSTPVVNSAIRDQGIIEGLSSDGVDDLVTQLNSGALAVPLRVVASMVLSSLPAAEPSTLVAGGPTPPIDQVIPASDCWTPEQRLDTRTPQWSGPPAMVIDPAKRYTATVETSLGDFTLTFFPEHAPVTVNNFVCLARAGYYDGTIFHRILDGFVIQGGDPTGTGRGDPGYRFADEPVTRDYELGTLAMANAGPDTNGSQFFIVVGDAGMQLPKNYTIFGHVSAGMDVVDRIAKVPTRAGAFGEKSVPIEPVTIAHVTIQET